jgi:hypothetical protein
MPDNMRAGIAESLDHDLDVLCCGANDDALSSTLPQLLTSGGDHRLKLDPTTLLNGYGCRPFPRPEAFTFASSTATSISNRAFTRARHAQLELLHTAKAHGVADALDQCMEQMRRRLKAQLRLDAGIEVVFSPSGTDTQLHALCVAKSILGPRCTSVIAAADETGSGTAFVSEGRHFADVTAQGAAVTKGDHVSGFEDVPQRIPVCLRDEQGVLRNRGAVDVEIIQSIASLIAEGGRVLLHAMDHSKCGFRSPSLECLQEVTARWPESVLVLVDACQMRLARPRLGCYLDSGYLVAITGSKFFTGPPFSGALLVPKRLSQPLRGVQIAPGLCDYMNRSDWPAHLWNIRKQLPDRHNLGQWLRWEAALEEIRAYFAVPAAPRRDMLDRFAGFVHSRISRSDCLRLLPMRSEPVSEFDSELPPETIFPFTLHRRGSELTRDDCARIYRLLNKDVSDMLSDTASPRQRAVAARPCHIGQPVTLRRADGSETGALRVSAGARIVSENWSPDEECRQRNFASELEQASTVFDKIEWMIAD